MPQKNIYNIRCPKCEAHQDVELYDSINVGTEPGLRDLLMTNQINNVVCDACDFSFRVDKHLLYNDPENRFMVNLIPAGPEDMDAAQQQFSTWLHDLTKTLPAEIEAPAMHLVFSRVELVERIFLLEAGLSARVIEYIKYMMYSRNQERLNPTERALLFDAQDSTPEQLCFVVQDLATQQLEEMLHYGRDAYEGLCEMFDRDEQTPSLMELFPGPYLSARVLFLKDEHVEQGSRSHSGRF